MNVSDVQILLASAGYYKSAVDGDAGPATWRGVSIIERNNRKMYVTNPARWSKKRRLIAAGQVVLHFAGYEPGTIDGYTGHNTQNALIAWNHKRVYGKRENLGRDKSSPAKTSGGLTAAQLATPRERNIRKVFGPPGGRHHDTGRVVVPFTMQYSWNARKKFKSFRCHKKASAPFTNAFEEAFRHYGPEEIKRLRLDRWGGCVNVRKKRGGSSWSMHSWGTAVDLDPDNNSLRWKSDRAHFARPEYEPFHKIMEDNGFTNLGRAENFDWMHWQLARP